MTELFECLSDRFGKVVVSVDDETLQQARQLHRTIRALQQRLVLRSMRLDAAGKMPTRELTLAQLTTLTEIHHRGSVNLKDLAEATHVSSPSASAMVDRLTDLGLALRHVSTSDRREVRIALTPDGADAVEYCERELLHTLTDLLHRLGADTAGRWCEVYEQIQDILDSEKATASAIAAR